MEAKVMNVRLIMLSGFLTLFISGLLPSYAVELTEPPVTLRTAANGLSLGKAQRNGQWVCLSFYGIDFPSINLYNAGTPWVNGLDVSTASIPYVSGSVWNGKSIFKTTVSKKERRFKGNGLPNHKTGIYPVQEGTPAYKWYAAAPGGPPYSSAAAIPIARYDLDIKVPKNPTYSEQPYCMNSLVTGVSTQTHAVWHANLAYGNTWVDPAAAFPNDECWGHPFNKEYHYHGYSWKCMPNQGGANTHSPLYGYAMDGFGIYGPRGDKGVLLSNDDLDECHGHIGQIEWDGKLTTMYHYHLNSEYPYGPGCYRGKPSNFNALKPHLHGYSPEKAAIFPPREPPQGGIVH
jgi:hypothetical protein